MRKLLIFLIIIIGILFLIKRSNMTWRQSILKTVYPLIMLKGKFFPSKKDIQLNTAQTPPPVSFYSLQAIGNDGRVIDFQQFKGKKVLLVNTASDCGFTGQYEELENLYRENKDKLVILGFPANDFKEQEKKDNADIASFCKINYGVSFQLMQKSQVVKGAAQNPVFQWLCQPVQNGWCEQAPLWNFSKYLVDEQGVLQGFYSQMIAPKKVL